MSTSRDDFGIAIRSALLQRGAKQKFSLFVLILISILIFSLDTLNLKPIQILRSVLNDSIYRISAISSLSSSAACLPTAGLAPAPRPLVMPLPIWSIVLAFRLFRA